MGKNRNKLYNFMDKTAACGQLLLLIEGFNVLLTSILLLCHIPISSIHFFLGFFIAAVCYALLYKDKKEKNVISIYALTILIIAAAISVNWLIQEIAYDGNLYHKFAAGILKMGWNPVYDNIYDYISMLRIPSERLSKTDIWAACYPKAAWYFDASVYAITGYIESAKIFNALTFIASFGICHSYFSQKLEPKYAAVISIVFPCIPVSIAQLFTYYVDGALGQLLLSSVVVLLSLSDEHCNLDFKKRQMIYLAVCIILCSNLKITGLAFEAVFCAAFFVYWCIKYRRIRIDVFVYYICVVFTSFCIVGAGTYIKNMQNYGNPFYPMIGADILDPSNSLKSVGLENASPIRQLLTMLFVRVSTDDSKTALEWKIPFTFKLKEFSKCTHDNIRGGGGVFFGGILIVSVIAFIYIIIRMYNIRKSECRAILVIIMASILLMVVMPAGGQARYSPYIYFLPYFTLYLWMLHLQDIQIRTGLIKNFCWIMLVITLMNSFAFSEYILRGMIQSYDYAAKYQRMKNSDGVYIDTVLPGNVFNFIDRNIIYTYKLENMVPEGEMKYLMLKYAVKND